jgi:predicted kinase
MLLIFISGPSATGKTAIGKHLADILGYEFHSKDFIKEQMFDKSGHTTWDYGWYERRAKRRFFQEVKEAIESNRSIIVESNFIGADKRRLARLLNKDVKISEIYCTTTGLTNFRRFVKRNEAGVRHPGHHDRRWYISTLFQTSLATIGIIWPYKPLGFTDKLMVIDSTVFSGVDYDKIIKFINEDKRPDYL